MKTAMLSLLVIVSLQAQQRHSQIRIPVRSGADMQRLSDLGIAVDHFDGKVGTAIDIFVDNIETLRLKQHDIPYSVLIDDWQEHYRQRDGAELTRFHGSTGAPRYFRYGAMGGYLTFQEILQQIDSMKLLFPSMVTVKESIGTSIEGRAIYAVKISDNPAADETSEPEILYTALHHAREPESMMTVIYFMWWLLENYGTDPEATYLVNNRELWFIPVVNPDGYVYNQETNPDGGGMHRKNRRDVGTVNKGVDLNRNYGPHFMWNADNPDGSSDSVDFETYRGSGPFSEPETNAIRNFMLSHDIKTCFNYHTYGNFLIYPWGYNSQESNDSLLYRYWAYAMSMTNRYTIGTDMQTVQYSTRGNSDDFMFSDSGKSVTFALTPEVGTSGFWPQRSQIYPLAEENLLQNKLLAYYAGSRIGVQSFFIENNNLHIRLINTGVQDAPDEAITLLPSQGTFPPSIRSGNIPSFETNEVIVPFSALIVDGPSSTPVKVYIKDSTGSILLDSVEFIAGEPVILFHDSALSPARWNTGSGWGTASEFANGNTYFTDSPEGNYHSNSNNIFSLQSSIDLAGYDLAELMFRTTWAIESTWDFAVVEVSVNDGITWTSLKTRLSRRGSGRNGSKQTVQSYGYDGFTPGLDWTTQTADLTPFANNRIKIRFRLSADAAIEHDGWYLDDIRVIGYHSTPNNIPENTVPYTFALSQNFPNPFNPTTSITFSLDQRYHTLLSVYNGLGQQMEVLVNQDLPAGNHSILFDAKKLSSGVYFYRLMAGTRSAIKKMTIVK